MSAKQCQMLRAQAAARAGERKLRAVSAWISSASQTFHGKYFSLSANAGDALGSFVSPAPWKSAPFATPVRQSMRVSPCRCAEPRVGTRIEPVPEMVCREGSRSWRAGPSCASSARSLSKGH